MTSRRVGSVIVVSSEGGPLGIVTDRDLRTRVVAVGLVPAAPVSAIMSSPLVSVDAGQMVFDGLIEMTRRNIHHLGVEERGRLIGVVSSHDLLLLQGAHPVALAREIEGQASVDGLVAMALRVHPVVKSLVSGGAGALDIGRIVAELNDRLVGRAVRFAEATLEREGLGRPPVPYSWLAAGSEGRREQTLRTDQDNGLLYEDPAAGETGVVADYFARLATVVGATLVRLGFPLCEGGFMATNPRWRQPASVWREYFDGWMEQPLPERLLSASIFLDLRPVAGDPRPGAELWEWVCERAPSRTLFLRHMAREAVSRQPPLGFFGRFVVERTGAHRDHLDLKARGVFPMTQGMRAYALSQGIRATNTVDRLAGLASQSIFAPAQAQELREAYGVISRLRLTHQLGRLESGQPPDNFVDPDTLGKADRLLLKEAFKTLGWLQRGLEDRFLTSALP
jgi:CBS domain-containing protein